MKIGILQTGHIPAVLEGDFSDYGEMFQKFLAGHDFEFEVYSVVDGIFPSAITDADGWLITGSKHGAYEDHPWIPPLEQFIRDTYSDGRPMIGVCFGHQIIAQALGGTVEKFSGGWVIGRTYYDFGSEKIALNAWHQDQVTACPPDARVIGSNESCANAALLYGDKMLTFQPHPEFPSSFIRGLIDTRGKGVVPETLLEQAQSWLEAPLDRNAIATQMADFFYKRRSS